MVNGASNSCRVKRSQSSKSDSKCRTQPQGSPCRSRAHCLFGVAPGSGINGIFWSWRPIAIRSPPLLRPLAKTRAVGHARARRKASITRINRLQDELRQAQAALKVSEERRASIVGAAALRHVRNQRRICPAIRRHAPRRSQSQSGSCCDPRSARRSCRASDSRRIGTACPIRKKRARNTAGGSVVRVFPFARLLPHRLNSHRLP